MRAFRCWKTSSEIGRDKRTHGYGDQRRGAVTQQSFTVTSAQSVQKTITSIGCHHDQFSLNSIRGVGNSLNDFPTSDFSSPFPAGYLRTMKGGHSIGLAHMNECENSVPAFESLH